jgi:phosphate-selective porin OprO and OprP
MRSPKSWCVLLALLCFLPVPLLHAQSTKPADDSSQPKSSAQPATEDEVQQLRREVAALRSEIQRLVEAKGSDSGPAPARLVQASAAVSTNPSAANTPDSNSTSNSDADADAIAASTDISPATIAAAEAQRKSDAPPVSAGWNGEHFFIKSADGQFEIMPYGYVDIDYRAYQGSGAPSDTFLLRRARFGFQGNYGSHFQFGLLTDTVTSSGATIRDVYLNAKVIPEFQLQFGQFKVPFGQEEPIGATNLDFVERGFQSLLYSDASSAYRSPGAVIHGDIDSGTLQYFVGAFNGRGFNANNQTNQPEVDGRIKLYPFRKHKGSIFEGLILGGSIDRARSRGLSGDESFSGTIPDQAYTFFPQFRINGPIERYGGDFTYLKGPWAVRAEYLQVNQHRVGVGSEQVGGLGFITLPGIIGRAWDLSSTYLLTGEHRPENGTPRVKHPLFGPETPGGGARGLGAWEVGVRYTGIQANEPGENLENFFTPGFVPTYNFHTDEITFGINWYPNYWIRYMLNLGIDQLHQPSTIGAEPQTYYVILQRIQFRF